MFPLLILASLRGIPVVTSASLEDYKNLINQMFTDYDNELRPVKDSSNILNILFGIDILSLVEIDEVDQSILLNSQFTFEWYDVSLSWNASLHNGIEWFYVEQKKIWRPDIFLLNTRDTRKSLGFSDLKVKISSAGLVTWGPGDIFRLSCSIDVTYFPFDNQTCLISVSTWTSTSREISLEVSSDLMPDNEEVSANELWEISAVYYSIKEESSDYLPVSDIYLTFDRRPSYYVMNILIPVMLLSAVSVLVFLVPADSGEKIGLSITVLLAFVVFLALLGDVLPATSLHTSYLMIYISVQIGLGCVSLVATVFVMNVHHRSARVPVPHSVLACCNLTKYLSKKKRQSNRVTDNFKHDSSLTVFRYNTDNISSTLEKDPLRNKDVETGHVIPGKEKGPVTWQKVAEVLDRILFVFLSLTSMVSAMTFLVILLGKSSN